MADKGDDHTDESMEGYTHNPDVPPPPSYDEAVEMSIEAASASASAAKGSHRPVSSRLLRPLSQIDKYKVSWLFPLMMRVKDTLHNVRKELKSMEDNEGELGQEIKSLEVKSYEAMLSLFLTGTVSDAEGDVLSEGAQSLLNSPNFRNYGTGPLERRYTSIQGELQKDLKPIRSWIREQLLEDQDWVEKKARIPTISNVELRNLKTSMMKVESKRSQLESLRHARYSDILTLKDYATDLLVKMDMENLWSLLTRMGDDEIGDGDSDNDKETATAPPIEETGEDDDVPEGDTDRLRQKRLQFYNRGAGPSDEDKDQSEEMLPKVKGKEKDEKGRSSAKGSPPLKKDEKGRSSAKASSSGNEGGDSDDDDDDEAKDSIATGGMATVSNIEEDRLRMRRLELYRQDSKQAKPQDDIAEEVEMVPVVKIVSEDDIDVETSSLPRSGSPDSYQEAIGERWLDVDRYSPKHSTMEDPDAESQPRRVHEFEIDETDAEAGRSRRRRSDDYDVGCMPLPFMRTLINLAVRGWRKLKRRWPEWSLQKKLIVVFSVLFVVGLVLLVSLLPASFVYVDYYEMGFAYNRATGKTSTDRVYDFGCYLLAPQYSLVLYPATAHFLDLKLSVMNKAGLTIGVEVYLQYLLRPNELSQMYSKYHGEYEKIIEIMAESTVKNMAIEFTMEEYRKDRPYVEARLFHRLRRVLSGDCCNVDNDRYKRFQTTLSHHNATAADANAKNDTKCNADTAKCDQGFHVDLAFFQLGAISIPSEVTSHYLQQIILRLENEKEQYIQEKAVEVKETSLRVQNISNQANEIREKAKSESAKIKQIAEASRLKLVEQSYVESFKKTFDKLNIKDEDSKASLLFLNTLKGIRNNLVAFTYNYDQESVLSP